MQSSLFLIGDFRERFVKLLYLFKKKLLVALIFSIVFLISISYITALIIVICFLLIILGFVHSFSISLKCKVRLFI